MNSPKCLRTDITLCTRCRLLHRQFLHRIKSQKVDNNTFYKITISCAKCNNVILRQVMSLPNENNSIKLIKNTTDIVFQTGIEQS